MSRRNVLCSAKGLIWKLPSPKRRRLVLGVGRLSEKAACVRLSGKIAWNKTMSKRNMFCSAKGLLWKLPHPSVVDWSWTRAASLRKAVHVQVIAPNHQGARAYWAVEKGQVAVLAKKST